MSVIEQPVEVPVEVQVIDPRVQNGAALLDKKMPGWADRINLDTLVMGDPDRCVLGQLGGYVALAYKLDIASEVTDLGFVGLDQDWRLAILSRRNGRA